MKGMMFNDINKWAIKQQKDKKENQILISQIQKQTGKYYIFMISVRRHSGKHIIIGIILKISDHQLAVHREVFLMWMGSLL